MMYCYQNHIHVVIGLQIDLSEAAKQVTTLSLIALELEMPALHSGSKWRQAGTSSFISTVIGAFTLFTPFSNF